jgi:hypothetical protein
MRVSVEWGPVAQRLLSRWPIFSFLVFR